MFNLFKPRGPQLGLIAPDEHAPQEQGKKDWDFDKLALGEALTDSGDLGRYVVTVLDQSNTQSCVAQAWEQAIRMERKRLGYPVLLGSRLFGYSNARAAHLMSNVDGGTFLRTYAWALKKVGNCPEAVWPFVTSRVNKPPPPDAFRQAWALRGVRGYFRIYDTGAARGAAVRAALAASKPVVFGTQVTKSFLSHEGPIIVGKPGEKDTLAGGHAMVIVGYEKHPKTGEWIYRIVNSWGPRWRDSGYAHITEEYLQWTRTQDLWVVSLVQ